MQTTIALNFTRSSWALRSSYKKSDSSAPESRHKPSSSRTNVRTRTITTWHNTMHEDASLTFSAANHLIITTATTTTTSIITSTKATHRILLHRDPVHKPRNRRLPRTDHVAVRALIAVMMTVIMCVRVNAGGYNTLTAGAMHLFTDDLIEQAQGINVTHVFDQVDMVATQQ